MRALDLPTCCLLLSLLVPAMAGAQTRPGVPVAGFPSWEERVLLVLTNRARADPQADLADCPAGNCSERACYTQPLRPLGWSYPLNRAARLHATLLADSGTFDHVSPCALHTDIATRYLPEGTCDGSVACACQGGLATCGTDGCTQPFDRIGRFGVGGNRAENVAMGQATPRDAFYAWFWEPTASAACGFTMENGHRHSILGAGLEGLGAGGHLGPRTHWVQDFGPARLESVLVAGAHEPKHGGEETEFRANFYDPDKAPTRAWVNVGGLCRDLRLERGTLANGTWLATAPVPTSGCTRYVFTIENESGTRVSLPEAGSYGVGDTSCEDWTAVVPATCEGGKVVHPDAEAGCGCTSGAAGTLSLTLAAILPILLRRRRTDIAT